MDCPDDFHTLRAMLEWQHDLGVTEAVGDVAINRYEVVGVRQIGAADVARAADRVPGAQALPQAVPQGVAAGPDPVAQATALAAGAGDLAALRAAIAGFDRCDLKQGARSLVFADGNPLARVMVLGEAPGREEDQQGLPFIGPAGQMLDRMFAAIGLSRRSAEPERALYITNIVPWRPPQNRDPSPAEIAMFMPFVARHVALIDPAVLVLMGNIPCFGVLGQRGITRLRGQWAEALGRPVLPMFHPAYLLRNPAAKREAWADLLALKARLG